MKHTDEMEKKYSGKRLKIEGTIKEVTRGTEKGAAVVIKGRREATEFTDILCSFEKSHPKFNGFLAELKEGDRTAFEGEFEAVIGTTTVVFENCELVR